MKLIESILFISVKVIEEFFKPRYVAYSGPLRISFRCRHCGSAG